MQQTTKTRAKIRAAYIELLKSRGFEAMTVSAIVRTAGINRGTFYLHYVDKFDLQQRLLDDVIDDLTAIMLSGSPVAGVDNAEDIFSTESIAEALRYIKRDYEFFDAVSGSGSDMQLYDRFKDVLKRMLIMQAGRLGLPMREHGDMPRDYALEIMVSSVVSIIWMWMRRGCEESPERICAIIERNKVIAPIDILK
ncbi:TetR/AcrR family transcriptional regulator [Bifidobacterium vansinderenii]|uniref:TetR family transcriptional regulator n=1 Tax=Bifidobacterium vansinderenii TaxID=1984871 RepID=A0A229VZV1_9BIFI|nr:TetR/AcrR family transcriptional regulator [Bifidobacterium vansinderenii]OXN01131.1 TetR family transcriptional regulator [Bifidobacterium vansinderenii]